MDSWRVIYPGGDKSKLDVAGVWDYEEDQWALASRKRFPSEAEAAAYARNLARGHGLEFEPDRQESMYLD